MWLSIVTAMVVFLAFPSPASAQTTRCWRCDDPNFCRGVESGGCRCIVNCSQGCSCTLTGGQCINNRCIKPDAPVVLEGLANRWWHASSRKQLVEDIAKVSSTFAMLTETFGNSLEDEDMVRDVLRCGASGKVGEPGKFSVDWVLTTKSAGGGATKWIIQLKGRAPDDQSDSNRLEMDVGPGSVSWSLFANSSSRGSGFVAIESSANAPVK